MKLLTTLLLLGCTKTATPKPVKIPGNDMVIEHCYDGPTGNEIPCENIAPSLGGRQ